MQTLNVHFGGTLRQHLWFHPYSKFKEDLVHEVVVSGEDTKFLVNSFHHQAIGKIGNNLVITATAKDGTIESIRHKEYNILAVQWHPERIFDAWSLSQLNQLF